MASNKAFLTVSDITSLAKLLLQNQ